MAHELARRADGRAAIAFVGETPWHGLGQELTKGASIGVWKKEAGLDWEALEGTPAVTYPNQISFPDYKGLYRSDTQEPLAIVGAGYQVVQPGEVLEFFREMVEVQGWYIHTAGALRGGRKVWALATNETSALVGKGDRINHNILLATSLDGSMRTTAIETSVRVVCANTLAMALNGATSGKIIKVSHRTEFDKDEVLGALGLQQDRFKVFMEKAKEMADTPVSMDQAQELLARVFKLDVKPKVDTSWMGSLGSQEAAADQMTNRGIESILRLFDGEGRGATLKTAKATRWGLLNAVTEHVDHFMGRSPDTRLDSAWFGRGSAIKADAFKILAEAE